VPKMIRLGMQPPRPGLTLSQRELLQKGRALLEDLASTGLVSASTIELMRREIELSERFMERTP